jgi:hypothetical protein
MIQEKRSGRRFPGRIGIVSLDDAGLNFGFITDLSREGAYIETEKVLPTGTPFQFVLSNGSAQAPVLSRVVRARDAFFHGGKSGFGIHFDRLEGAAKSVRDDLLLALMARRYHDVWDED